MSQGECSSLVLVWWLLERDVAQKWDSNRETSGGGESSTDISLLGAG